MGGISIDPEPTKPFRGTLAIERAAQAAPSNPAIRAHTHPTDRRIMDGACLVNRWLEIRLMVSVEAPSPEKSQLAKGINQECADNTPRREENGRRCRRDSERNRYRLRMQGAYSCLIKFILLKAVAFLEVNFGIRRSSGPASGVDRIRSMRRMARGRSLN